MQPIFVRKLSKIEKEELQKLLKSTDTRLYKRARVIWLSALQRLKATEITKIVDLHLNKVRKYICRFNERGISGLYQKPSPGRPPEIKTQQRRKIIRLLKTKPAALGLSVTSWNLRELAIIAQKKKIVNNISHMHLWRIIKEEGYSYKRSKRWITSPDPGYEVKKNVSRGRLGVWTKLAR
ncbi:MAG: helix-turn-helix domain-containing protein [Candidatus Omnitrophota bacterium]|nr:helix-turn-helix domain-containing protein [Candidatus Omnitrophota bacterium]